MTVIYLLLIFCILCIAIYAILKMRNIQIWFYAYLAERCCSLFKKNEYTTKHIYFCFADHYEPYWGKVTDEIAMGRVLAWTKAYPKAVDGHYDSNGNKPKHTFFYPEEEYRYEIIEKLKEFVESEIADVEIHLHHDNDTVENLEITLNRFKTTLYEKHGLLRKDERGDILYSFIHGNWALDNSRPDGRYCGVDNELNVLKRTGCYIDLTMPSAPSNTQTKIINSIYLAKGISGQIKSHDKGIRVRPGMAIGDDELLLLQGPLTLNWTNRKWGLIPRVESAEISYNARPSETRLQLWEKSNVCIEERENHIFIKLHTHGAEDDNIKMLFAEGEYDSLLTMLEKKFRDNKKYQLHYVSAWEMYMKIRELINSNPFDKEP